MPTARPEPRTLDVRPLLARGDSPLGTIEEAVDGLQPGQSLILLVPFEPIPLYTKLGLLGFAHEASQGPDGTWRVEFRPEDRDDDPLEPEEGFPGIARSDDTRGKGSPGI